MQGSNAGSLVHRTPLQGQWRLGGTLLKRQCALLSYVLSRACKSGTFPRLGAQFRLCKEIS